MIGGEIISSAIRNLDPSWSYCTPEYAWDPFTTLVPFDAPLVTTPQAPLVGEAATPGASMDSPSKVKASMFNPEPKPTAKMGPGAHDDPVGYPSNGGLGNPPLPVQGAASNPDRHGKPNDPNPNVEDHHALEAAQPRPHLLVHPAPTNLASEDQASGDLDLANPVPFPTNQDPAQEDTGHANPAISGTRESALGAIPPSANDAPDRSRPQATDKAFAPNLPGLPYGDQSKVLSNSAQPNEVQADHGSVGDSGESNEHFPAGSIDIKPQSQAGGSMKNLPAKANKHFLVYMADNGDVVTVHNMLELMAGAVAGAKSTATGQVVANGENVANIGDMIWRTIGGESTATIEGNTGAEGVLTSSGQSGSLNPQASYTGLNMDNFTLQTAGSARGGSGAISMLVVTFGWILHYLVSRG